MTRLVLLLLAGIFAPGETAAQTQTCVWPPDLQSEKLASGVFGPEAAIWRQAAAMQAAELQWETSGCNDKIVSECSLAAERGAAKIADVSAPGYFTARAVGEEIISSPLATRSYRSLQLNGYDVNIVNRADGNSGLIIDGVVNVNRRYNRSAREAVATIVHESKHAELMRNTGNYYGTRGTTKGEYMARAREFLFTHGRRPTAAERDSILSLITSQGY